MGTLGVSGFETTLAVRRPLVRLVPSGSSVLWPCDACFVPDGQTLLAQWRGGIYGVGGLLAARLAARMAAAAGGVEPSIDLVADLRRLAAELDRAALDRSSTDQTPTPGSLHRMPKAAAGKSPRLLVASCLAPLAAQSVSVAVRALTDPAQHLLCGYDWFGQLVPLLRRYDHGSAAGTSRPPGARPPLVCLLTSAIAGEVADWLNHSRLVPWVTWAVLWPEGLYVVEPGSHAAASLAGLVARAEANLDSMAAGITFMRANTARAFVIREVPGPSEVQIRALLSIAQGFPSKRPTAWRISPQGSASCLDVLFLGPGQGAPATAAAPESSAEPSRLASATSGAVAGPERLIDRRMGIITFEYPLGTLAFPGGQIVVWRAGFGAPRHILGRADSAKFCLDAFAADADPDLARLKALMEAVERYGGMRWPDGRWCRSKQRDLGGEVLNPDEVPGYLPQQYSLPDFGYAPFSADQEKIWLQGRSLLTDCRIWVLSDLIVWPPLENPACVQATSSGTAAHRSWTAACTAALYELIERDSLMLAWLMRAACPKIPLSRLPPSLQQWAEGIATAGYRVHLVDVTSDIEIPVVLALAEASCPGRPHMLAHGAAGPDLAQAAAKGLTELAKMIVYQAVRGYDSLSSKPVEECVHPGDHARLYYAASRRSQWEFLISNGSATDRLEARADSNARTGEEELRRLVRRVGRKGPLAAVDRTPLTARAAGLRVVSVVSAGLQPIHFGPFNARLRSHRLTERAFADSDVPGPLNLLPHPYS